MACQLAGVVAVPWLRFDLTQGRSFTLSQATRTQLQSLAEPLLITTAGGTAAFTGSAWKVEADGLSINGFKPARATKGGAITMQFKKPHEVVGNHIAKYQSMRLAKMLMAYDFERKLNPFGEMGGFIYTFMGDGAPGTATGIGM